MLQRPYRLAGLMAVTLTTLMVGGAGRTAVRAKEITFTEDVAPIVFAKCASCHRPGEAAPFSLLSYDEVKRHGRALAVAVTSRAMPPWKAVGGDFSYSGDRRLTEAQIETLKDWVAAGMPEGDPARLPPTP